MQGALLQLNVSDDPVANLVETTKMFRAAVAEGAGV